MVPGDGEVLLALGSGGQTSVLLLLSASNLLLVTMLQKAKASTTASSSFFPSSIAAFLATGLGVVSWSLAMVESCSHWGVVDSNQCCYC